MGENGKPMGACRSLRPDACNPPFLLARVVSGFANRIG